jgi:hypothetical protein
LGAAVIEAAKTGVEVVGIYDGHCEVTELRFPKGLHSGERTLRHIRPEAYSVS